MLNTPYFKPSTLALLALAFSGLMGCENTSTRADAVIKPLQVQADPVANAPQHYENPILRGGFPDPSIVRVGNTYYLANSSFIWFPGVPIHRSHDLVNWELVSYALSDPASYNISHKTGAHGGAWAPTIRYHDGLFYLTVTQKSSGDSILVTAQTPEGPWSTPVVLHDQNGIDGSLFFDDDGRAWYTWSEDHLILLREFDIQHQKLVGEKILLLNEQMFGNDYSHIEGPHLYKLDSGEYMLLIASGGTGSNNHNVSVFKSDRPTGPYYPAPHNPVLTHKDTESPFKNIGHADIVQTQNGDWYAVSLGVQDVEGKNIMDRETFMTGFEWQDGWPVFPATNGFKVLAEEKRPNLPWTPVAKPVVKDEFENKTLGLDWNFYHTPMEQWWSLTEAPGKLRIKVRPETTNDQANPSLIARRITAFDFEASTKLSFMPAPGETAGLIAMMNQRGQLRLEMFNERGQTGVRLIETNQPKQKKLESRELGRVAIDSNQVILHLKAQGLDYRFYVETPQGELEQVGAVANGAIISRQMARSYSGAYVGMFASSNGKRSVNHAEFDWFSYQASNH